MWWSENTKCSSFPILFKDEREREDNLPSACLLSKWSQQHRGKPKPGFEHWWQGPRHLSCLLLLSQSYKGELDQRGVTWLKRQRIHVKCQNHKKLSNPSDHIAGLQTGNTELLKQNIAWKSLKKAEDSCTLVQAVSFQTLVCYLLSQAIHLTSFIFF